MIAPWITDEMKTVALPDKRLNQRLQLVLSQLAAHPTASIPAACGGRAEMVAAYRFFENENTTFDNILQPHVDVTRQRMGAQPIVVLAQDTSEINVTRPEQQVAGAGPLDGNSRRGALAASVARLHAGRHSAGKRSRNRVDARGRNHLRFVDARPAGRHAD